MWNNLKKHSITLFLLCALLACSKVPDGVLSEADMQKVLLDMQVAEALTGINYQDYAVDSVKLALYESVFRKHKITQAKYDSSLVWYGRNLDIYMKVYERMIADLNRQIANLGDVQASAAPSSNRDSVDIWPRRTMLVLQPENVFNAVTFDIQPESNYSSGSSFVLGLRVWGLKDNLTYKPEIRLNAVHRDTILTVNKEIDKDGYYEVVLRTMPTRQVRKVYGYIRLDNNDQDYTKVYIDSLNLIKYNYGTAIPGHPD
ncbi:DUF4296 domain-containing protein [Parabacteroides sp. OttesenSCG-928-G07]|nr:DUF4296 domain-containing protein [Parabacteroides sp. OttesenSCG-928-G21]MDL2278803.1 DUF4296 domain-containing protein [Parabacteroides sp. OttesenSCG-928-G07]